MRRLPLVLVAAALAACNNDALTPCIHVHADAGVPDLASPMAMLPPVCRNVFTIASDNTLQAFDPNTYAFTLLGTLRCPSRPGWTPFSMAVARDNVAYVLYNSPGTPAEIFRVDLDSLECTVTRFVPGQEGFDSFGMGFAADEPYSEAETLYIAGAENSASQGLARITLPDFRVRRINDLDVGSPELTGTQQAQLWAFFPQTASVIEPFVAQLDKTTARRLFTFPLPTLTGAATAWAFAFWGGGFFLFLERGVGQNTTVFRLDRSTADLKTVVPDAGRRIVGAGVSSCAPVGP